MPRLGTGTTKTGDGRGLLLKRDAVLALRAVLGNHERCCCTYHAKRKAAVGSAWKQALTRAGIEEFRYHDFAHTRASWHVMALRYAQPAAEHLSDTAFRIEWELEFVENNPTISLRSKEEGPKGKQ